MRWKISCSINFVRVTTKQKLAGFQKSTPVSHNSALQNAGWPVRFKRVCELSHVAIHL